MNLIGIKTNDDYYYITDNIGGDSYFHSKIAGKVVNGNPVEPTWHKDWFKVKGEPIKVEYYQSHPNVNKRYELRDKSLSDKFKDVYLFDDVYKGEDGNYNPFFSDEFQSIAALYCLESDEVEPTLESMDFTFQKLVEIEEVKTPQGFSYNRSGQWSFEKYPDVTDKNVKYGMIDLITVPSLLLPTRPSKLTIKESYDIVRAYVKTNIDPKVAEVTSDYDFCFTVKKKINLAKEHVYQVDVNDNFFGLLGKKKKKPKYETKVQKVRSVEVFQMCHAPYNGYTPIAAFAGENQDDLKDNIDNYLAHLISVINEPLHDCDKCNGAGVLINTL